MDIETIEEFIFGLAQIVQENWRLKRELEEAREYEKKYHDLLDESGKNAAAGQKALLEAIMCGAFSTKE